MSAARDITDYLRDMVEAMSAAEEFTAGMNFEQFVQDRRTTFAVIQALEVIGEAAKHIPTAVRHRYPSLPWVRMAGMRDRLIHGYFGVDLRIVWETATQLIPPLKLQVQEVLRAEVRRAGGETGQHDEPNEA